ncbi:hypothetical protein [Microbacterium timonense]|uniref:hypothetical protein n=1 Tax=Microbacterium timonense TaxID=2086576 RepID=UPI000D108F56|nr:hypothetical protein [Microbacterium timonense]
MSDPRFRPRPPDPAPDRRTTPEPTDLRNQPALQTGATRRWLVPATAFAAIAVVMFAIAFSLQFVLPLIGIVFVVAMWVGMLVVSRRPGDVRTRNRRLAWFMGSMAVGALLAFVGIYIVEATRAAQLM